METFLAGARVVVSLAVVLALLWVLQRRLTRGSRKSASGRPVSIVTKQSISPKASVVIIDVEGTRLLLGVTEHAVNVLQSGEAPEPAAEAAPAIAPASGAKTFAESLSKVTTATFTSKKPAPATAGAGTASSAAAPKPAKAKKNTDFTPATAFTVPGQGGGLLAGSIVSPATWKQFSASLRRGR